MGVSVHTFSILIYRCALENALAKNKAPIISSNVYRYVWPPGLRSSHVEDRAIMMEHLPDTVYSLGICGGMSSMSL